MATEFPWQRFGLFTPSTTARSDCIRLEMFKRAVKAKISDDYGVTHVLYDGVAPALTGLRDSSVQACTLLYTSLVKNMHENELRVRAVQRKNRLRWLPDAPTTGQQGYPDLDTKDAFINTEAPKGPPPAVIAKLESALRKTIQDPTLRRKLEDLEVQPIFMDSRQTQQWLEEEVLEFSTLIRETGLAGK